jgi:hypothetical protein
MVKRIDVRRIVVRQIAVSHRAALLSKPDLKSLLAVYGLQANGKHAHTIYSACRFPEWKSYGSVKKFAAEGNTVATGSIDIEKER